MQLLPQWTIFLTRSISLLILSKRVLLDRGCTLCRMPYRLIQCGNRGIGMQLLPQRTVFLAWSIELLAMLRLTSRAVVVSVFVVGTNNINHNHIHILDIVLCRFYRLCPSHATKHNL